MTYDGEGRLLTSAMNGVTTAMTYDGLGNRVKMVTGGRSTEFVYGVEGELAEEYDTAAPAMLGTVYLAQDALGSTRALFDTQTHYMDYLPFGELVPTTLRSGSAWTASDELRTKFTGKERDAETGLDYFGARYFSGAQGRFTSPDPYVFQFAAASHTEDDDEQKQLQQRYISNPQAWNKYAYGVNNPLKFVDPNGRCSKPTNQKEGETGICVEAFIAQNWFRLVGRGDNRGFSGTDKALTARSRVKLTVSKNGKVTSQDVESARSGVVVKGVGLRGDTVAQVSATPNKDGSISVHVSLWGRNGEAALAPLAPSGVLQGNFNLNISKSGDVTFVPAGSSATTFPSWGIYGYGPNGSVQTVKEIPEHKIEDLQKPPAPIK